MTKVLQAEVDFSSFVKFDQQLMKLQGTTRKATEATIGYQKAGQNLTKAITTTNISWTATDRIMQRAVVGMKSLSADLNKMTFGFEQGALSANKTKTSLLALTTGMNPLQKEFKESTKGAKTATEALEMLENQTRATAAATAAAAASGGKGLGGLNPNNTQKGKISADPDGNIINQIGGRTNRAVLQNTAFQLQDIIVQLEMGVPVTRTLAQQLPQLLGAFGALGAGIGVLVGGGLSILPFLFRDTASEAEDLSKQTIDLSKSYADLSEAQKMAQMSTSNLKEEFGGASSSLREFLRLQAEQAQRNFELDKKSITGSIAGSPSFAPVVERVQEYLDALALVTKQATDPEQFGPKVINGIDVSPGAEARKTLELISGNLDRDYAGLRAVGDALTELENVDANDFKGLSEVGVKVTQALQALNAEELGIDPAEIRLVIAEIAKVTKAGFDGIFSATEKAIFAFAQGIDERAEGLGQKYLDALDAVAEKQASSVESLTKQLNEAEKRLGIETALELMTEGSSTAGVQVDVLRETIARLKEELMDAKEAAELLEIEKLIPGISKVYEEAMESVKEKQENSLPVLRDQIEKIEAQIIKTKALGESTDTLEAALDALNGKFLSAAQEIALAAAAAANAKAKPKGRGDAIPGPTVGSLPAIRDAASKSAIERETTAFYEKRKALLLASAKRGLELATNKVDGVQVIPKVITGGRGKTEAELEAERLFKLAEKAKKGYRTINETLLSDINDLKAALAAGFFDEEDRMEMDLYNRALADLTQQLEYGGLSVKSFADTLEGELNNAFSSVVDGSKTVSEAMIDMVSNILTEIANQQFQNNISSPIATGLSDMLTGWITGGSSGGIGSIRPKARPSSFSALGNAFDGESNIIPFAKGGIVNSPTLFPFANGTGLMGEAGPEAIMPLARGAGGKLGVIAQGAGGGGNNVTLIVENNGTNAEADVQQDSNGAIRLILSAVNRDIQEGGKTYRTLRKTFGVGPMTQGRG